MTAEIIGPGEKDGQTLVPADNHRVLSIADVDMSGGFLSFKHDRVAAGDDIPRPPYDPLTTGDKVRGVVDAAASLGGAAYALRSYHKEGLHVLRADIGSIEKLADTHEMHEFRNLGTTLKGRIDNLTADANRNVIALQDAKPELFDTHSNRGVFGDRVIKIPRGGLLNESETAIVDRASNLQFLGESVRRGVATESVPKFKSGLNLLKDLHLQPAAVEEGLAGDLERLQDLGGTVRYQVAKSTVSLGAESQTLMNRNIGIVGAGLGTNYLLEKYVFTNSAPNRLTIGIDMVSPSIILTELPLWAKFGVIVGAHAVSRLAEYGTRKAGHEK